MFQKLTLVLVLVIMPFLSAYAQQSTLEVEEHITGLDIEDHFKKIEKLYTGEKPDMDAISNFVAQYPLDDFILTETVTTNRGTQEPETNQKNKSMFIEQEKIRNYELLDTRIRHTLTNIKYLDDKVSAKVSYTSLFQGKYRKHTQTYGLAIIPFKSLSVCTDVLKLVNGQIKGYRADCKTDIIYDDPVPVK